MMQAFLQQHAQPQAQQHQLGIAQFAPPPPAPPAPLALPAPPAQPAQPALPTAPPAPLTPLAPPTPPAPPALPPQLAASPDADAPALPQTTTGGTVGAPLTAALPPAVGDSMPLPTTTQLLPAGPPAYSEQLQQAQDRVQALERALLEANTAAASLAPDARGSKRSADAAFVSSASSSSSSSVVPTSVHSDAVRAAAQRSALDDAFRSDDDKGPHPIFGTGTHPEAQLIASQQATFNEMKVKIQEKYFKHPESKVKAHENCDTLRTISLELELAKAAARRLTSAFHSLEDYLASVPTPAIVEPVAELRTALQVAHDVITRQQNRKTELEHRRHMIYIGDDCVSTIEYERAVETRWLRHHYDPKMLKTAIDEVSGAALQRLLGPPATSKPRSHGGGPPAPAANRSGAASSSSSSSSSNNINSGPSAPRSGGGKSAGSGKGRGNKGAGGGSGPNASE